MYKIYDVNCESCNNEKEILISDKETLPNCSICGGKLKRVFRNFNFKLIYDNKSDTCSWGDHGYASSQYYRKVKEAKANGEQVKAP